MFYRRWGKRVLDVCVSALLLVVLAPLLLAVALATYLAHGSPVLFRQQRPGLKGAPFTLLKFRTMREAFDERGEPLDDHLRTTRVGAFLRRSSLDELPELLNVLKGEMSLVGPRPLMMEYLPRYSREQARRHDVRPGITGLAQVNGRNAISWEQKFEHDVWYVDHQSLWLDIKILWLTFVKVFKREGINAADGGWTEPFKGSKK